MKKKIVLFFLIILFLLSTSCLAVNNSELNINSEACILVEASTNTALYEKNSKEKMFPASTTKILTALLVLEHCKLDDSTVVSNSAVSELEAGYVTPYITVGEVLTVEQLLNILLIPSGNVAGNVLAELVSGSIQDFSTLMNKRAEELGCINSHFTNPYGKHDDNHYTCAYDLYLITKEAMKYNDFKNIVSKTSYDLEPTNKHSRNDRTLYTTNDLIKSSSTYYYKYAIGIKTGFTSQAKECLVSAATKDNMTLYAIMLGADKSDSGISYRYNDAKKLFDFGFNNYLFRTIKSKGNSIKTVEVKGATNNTKKLDLLIDSNITALISVDDEYSSFIPDIEINELSAPIEAGSIVGKVSYSINGLNYSANLIAASNVEKSYTFVIILGIASFILFMLVLKLILSKKKRKKKSKYKGRLY